MQPASDRRAHRRLPAAYQVKVVTSEDLVTFGRALDVSEGGILLVAEPRLPVGETVGIVIFLADSGPASRVVTRGRVVRSDHRGNAIRFLEALDPEAHRVLARRLAEAAPEA